MNGAVLVNWKIYPINLDNLVSATDGYLNTDQHQKGLFAPTFFHGELYVNSSYDTFLHLPGWSKGQAFVNGFNLGRSGLWLVHKSHCLYQQM